MRKYGKLKGISVIFIDIHDTQALSENFDGNAPKQSEYHTKNNVGLNHFR
jgi:hypothetical protein